MPGQQQIFDTHKPPYMIGRVTMLIERQTRFENRLIPIEAAKIGNPNLETNPNDQKIQFKNKKGFFDRLSGAN